MDYIIISLLIVLIILVVVLLINRTRGKNDNHKKKCNAIFAIYLNVFTLFHYQIRIRDNQFCSQ